jgi:hypothetical protein
MPFRRRGRTDKMMQAEMATAEKETGPCQMTEASKETGSRNLVPTKRALKSVGVTSFSNPPSLPGQTAVFAPQQAPHPAPDPGVASGYPATAVQITGFKQLEEQQPIATNMTSLRSLQFWQSFQRMEMSRYKCDFFSRYCHLLSQEVLSSLNVHITGLNKFISDIYVQSVLLSRKEIQQNE